MTNSPLADQRERVHQQLSELYAAGTVDEPFGLPDSEKRFAPRKKWPRARLDLHEALLAPYRSAAPGVGNDGRCAVVTSGPPGAGKGSALATVVPGLGSYRRIDADDFKVWLVEDALEHDYATYGPVLETWLADGKPVMPMELSSVFHRESTHLARRALRLALTRGENVVIEGTLSWAPIVRQYATALAAADYTSVLVLDLATARAVAHGRAKSRWWEGRLDGALGGRFTPAIAIDAMYDTDGVSICTAQAHALVEVGEDLGLEVELISVATSSFGDPDPDNASPN